MSELKPCPFCGGEAVLKQYNHYDMVIDTYYPAEIEDDLNSNIDTYPECKKCGCALHVYETARKAIEAWNRRADDERTKTD